MLTCADLLRNEIPLNDDIACGLDPSTGKTMRVKELQTVSSSSFTTTYPQFTFPAISIDPYASILSSTVKSPLSVMFLPDLIEPMTSSGP